MSERVVRMRQLFKTALEVCTTGEGQRDFPTGMYGEFVNVMRWA